MARKSAQPQINPRALAAVEQAELEAEVRGEMADAAIEEQDDNTKALIDRIVSRLRQSVSGEIVVAGERVPISAEAVTANLRYAATEVLKTLAVFDIQVGTYTLPQNACVICAVEL